MMYLISVCYLKIILAMRDYVAEPMDVLSPEIRATYLDDMRDERINSMQGYVVDFSLALINKTGAYYVSKDLIQHLSHVFIGQRYWRLRLRAEPRGLFRRVLARAMLMELAHPGIAALLPRRRPAAERALFLDPLYVLFSGVSPGDVVLCHDVGPLTVPEAFNSKTVEHYREAYGLIRAARPGMVFVSEASRRAFVSLFGDDYRFLKVIPLYTRPEAEQGEEKAPPAMEAPFLLTIGALETRKNYPRSIEAFQRSGLHARGYEYVICGPRGNSAAEVERLASDADGVRWLGYLSDAELRWLYRHATGFVLPSLLEGFGLPALEAAKNGLVPLISKDGALVEAASTGAICVDPFSVDDIAGGMVRLVDMGEEERAETVAMLQEHARSMSLERFIGEWRGLLTLDLGAVTKEAVYVRTG